MSRCDMDCYDAVSAKMSEAQSVLINLISNDHFKTLSDELLSELLSASVSLLSAAERELRKSWEENE